MPGGARPDRAVPLRARKRRRAWGRIFGDFFDSGGRTALPGSHKNGGVISRPSWLHHSGYVGLRLPFCVVSPRVDDRYRRNAVVYSYVFAFWKGLGSCWECVFVLSIPLI